MRECHILRPELFALVAPLRRLLKSRAGATMTLAMNESMGDALNPLQWLSIIGRLDPALIYVSDIERSIGFFAGIHSRA